MVQEHFLQNELDPVPIRANRRRGYGPFVLGLFAALGVLVGKFWCESSPVMYTSVGVLLIASVWNACSHRATVPDCCAENLLTRRRSIHGKEN
jgi:hypothetical protein